MIRGTRDRLHVLALGVLAGALAYHLTLTRPWARGAGCPR